MLSLDEIPLGSPAVIDAMTAAALASRLLELRLRRCNLSPASVPALARLIRGGVLKDLTIYNSGNQLLDVETAEQLADALATSRTLTRLNMAAARFWHDTAAATAIMRALTGHLCLQALCLSYNDPPDQFAAGAALGALVAADAPALAVLSVQGSDFGDAGLGGLFYALPRNSHLRALTCFSMGMSEAFARGVVLPAVRANTSLRVLFARTDWDELAPPPELLEAEALVAARNNGGA